MIKKFTRLAVGAGLLIIFASACSQPDAPEEQSPGPTLTPDAAEEPRATVTPPTATATPIPVTPTGESLSGVALWGNEPVADARLELRAVDWRVTGDETAIASATAGAAGQFLFAGPPVGEYSLVAYWPDGEFSQGGTPVVTIGPDQTIAGQAIKLERGLTLLEPDLSEPVATLPGFAWEPLEGIMSYRVRVIDGGTTEAVVEEVVTEPALTVTEQLEPARDYRLAISALSPDGSETLANVEADFRTQDTLSVPPPLALPLTCIQPGLATYIDRDTGICLAFPQKFGVGDTDQGAAQVVGSPVDRSPESLFASLMIENTTSGGADLAALVDDRLAQLPENDFEIRRLPTTLGGEVAELLEPVPGDLSSRQVLTRHGQDEFLALTFTPSFREMAAGTMITPQRRAQIDADLLFETVMASFAYLPQPGEEAGDSRPIPENCVAHGKGVFIDTEDGYCFGFPAGFSHQIGSGGPTLAGPALDQSLSPVRALFTLSVEDVTEARSLEDVLAVFAGADESGESITIGDRPATLLSGVAGKGTTYDVFFEKDGRIYHLAFQPDAGQTPEAADDIAALFEMITQSFSFLEAEN